MAPGAKRRTTRARQAATRSGPTKGNVCWNVARSPAGEAPRAAPARRPKRSRGMVYGKKPPTPAAAAMTRTVTVTMGFLATKPNARRSAPRPPYPASRRHAVTRRAAPTDTVAVTKAKRSVPGAPPPARALRTKRTSSVVPRTWAVTTAMARTQMRMSWRGLRPAVSSRRRSASGPPSAAAPRARTMVLGARPAMEIRITRSSSTYQVPTLSRCPCTLLLRPFFHAGAAAAVLGGTSFIGNQG
ncbi:hypothetical protein GQ55_4G305200 [Panicum hallii var. hallii]|uniref:Uncharacterized protein n=1 Tax=Panicum hallii var. hallii TaxID=1504633 RepID=A0A2T7E1U3_9POAL|nr:hypothetical protein GQ55_4G305200 [Panicum hallii var. hallii]